MAHWPTLWSLLQDLALMQNACGVFRIQHASTLLQSHAAQNNGEQQPGVKYALMK